MHLPLEMPYFLHLTDISAAFNDYNGDSRVSGKSPMLPDLKRDPGDYVESR